MKKLYMKIAGYDEQSNSLLVSFASDTTKSQNPEDYEAFAYQPLSLWPDLTDVSELPKLIAQAGMYQVSIKEKEEQIPDRTKINEDCKKLVGSAFTYDTIELLS